MTFAFDNTYRRLPARFFASVSPTKVRAPRIVKINRPLAEALGLDPDALASPEGAQLLAGNVLAAGAEPIALAYAGHQFGSFVPQLGDGRDESCSWRGRRQERAALRGRPAQAAPAGPLSHAGATGARRSGPSSASTS